MSPNNSSMIKIRTLYCLTSFFLLFASCNQNNEPSYELELLSEVLDDMTKQNLQVVNQIHSEAEKKGRRRVDVEVSERAMDILKNHKKFQIPTDATPELASRDLSRLDQYIGYLDSTNSRNNSKYRNKIWEDHLEALRHFQSKTSVGFSQLDSMNILVYLTFLERELIWGLAEEIGGGHSWFEIDINYRFEKETIRLGEDFEMIISPESANLWMPSTIKYENSQLVFNDSSTHDFHYRKIGSSAYVKFSPKNAGLYLFRSTFRVNFEEGEYIFDQEVAQHVVVLKPD